MVKILLLIYLVSAKRGVISLRVLPPFLYHRKHLMRGEHRRHLRVALLHIVCQLRQTLALMLCLMSRRLHRRRLTSPTTAAAMRRTSPYHLLNA